MVCIGGFLNFYIKTMKSIYIWGAGYCGILTALKFEAEGIKINGFIDKNANSIKTKLGLPVIEPDKILSDKNQNFQIIIAVQNENAINEIKEQLKKFGLNNEDDFKLSPLITKNLSETEISNIKSGLKKIKERKYTQIKFLTEKSKNIHFMYNDKFANPTIEFINKNFQSTENLFLVSRLVPEDYTMQKFPAGENVIELNPDEFDYSLLNPRDLINKRLIFHSLFNQNDVNLLYENQDLLKHSYWMVWGGDLYSAPTDEANTFVRQNIYGIGSFSDNDLVKQKYDSNHVFFDTNMALPPCNYDSKILYELRNRQIKNEAIVIQVNNSADYSTLEMFDVLARFKNENIHIKTILSYGAMNFKEKIIEKGHKIFGDKFSYLDKILLPKDYAEYLASNDILILNHNRQQGGSNAISSVILGKKVFIKSEITTTQYFLKNKINVFDTNKIKDMSFYEFCEMSQEIILNNVKNVEMLTSTKKIISDFSIILNDPCPSLKKES